MEKMAGNCSRDDGNAVRPKYYEQRTLIFPDGIQITQVFDAPTFRRIDSGDTELIAQIRKNYDESLGSGGDLLEIATQGLSKGSDCQEDDTSVGESLEESPETFGVTSDVEESSSRYMFWTKPATNLLLSLYEEYEQEFENPRKKKKDVWREITEKLNEAGFDFSQLKVENKWRSLVQSHKDIKDNKKKTGEKRRTFPHFERLDNILSKRHDINPPFTSSSNPLATKENEKDKASTSSEEKVVTKSSSISAVRRREKRKEAENEGSSFFQAFKEIEKVRKLEQDEQEKRRDERAKERNDLLRAFLEILKEKENEGHINLTDLPPEVLEKICYNLEQFEEVNKLTLVCKKLKYFCYHRNTSFSVHLKNVNNLCGVYCMPNLRKLTVCGRSYFNSVIDADQVKSREFDAFVELFAMASLTRLQCLTLKNFRFQNTFLLFLIALSHLQLTCLSFHRCSQISVGQLKCVLEEIPSLKYCDVECDVSSTEDMHIFDEIANQFVGQVNLNLNNLEEIPSVLLKYRRSKYRTPWPTGHLLIP